MDEDNDEEMAPLELADGTLIELYEDEDWIGIYRLRPDAEEADGLILPPLPWTFAGAELVASPDEAWVVLWVYSGQSEEAIFLVAVRDELILRYASGYLGGEAGSLGFSPDAKRLAFALPTTCNEWWELWDDGVVLLDEENMPWIHFGQLVLVETETGQATTRLIRVLPPDGWQPEQAAYDPFMRPTFLEDGMLELQMPWGPEQVDPNATSKIDFYL